MTETVHELETREQKIVKVFVFTNRAEVRRLVKVSLKQGINQVVLNNLSRSLVNGSLRVEGRGKAVIHDVVVKNRAVLKQELDSQKIANLRSDLKDARKMLQSSADEGSVIEKCIENLDNVFKQVGSGFVNSSNDGKSVVLNGETLNSIDKFFKFYQSNAQSYVQQLRRIEAVHTERQERTKKFEQELSLLENPQHSGFRSQYATITLEASEESDGELEVIYQVNDAGWVPSYDVRVDTLTPSLNIAYFGKIRQFANEDWTDVPLVLSTAQPTLGGKIPTLGTLEATFRAPMIQQANYANFGATGGSSMLFGMSARAPHPAPPTMEHSVASEVVQNTLSTEFQIPRAASIPHGTVDHKVTIGLVNLSSPRLVYESVPSKHAAAYLTASVTNSSAFAFLAGDSSVFLNGAFVAKSNLKNVSPGEKFTCSLGVDPAVRVEYKPAKKYHEEGGFITKHSSNVTEHAIVVKNTHVGRQVVLTVKHHVPRSTDEKIRVRLISPETVRTNGSSEGDEEGAVLNSSNNLEWTVKLAPETNKELVIKYVVEHPKEETVLFREQFL